MIWPSDLAEAVQDAAALGPAAGLRVGVATDAAPGAALPEDGVLSVPFDSARAALERSGVAPERIRVEAPVLGDFDLDAPAAPPADARGYVFLALLDWTRASGWDVLVRAFAEEFGPGEDVSLVIRAWSSRGFTPHVVSEAMIAALEADGHDLDALPDIILEFDEGFARPHAGHYAGADWYVSPARGDAFGRRLLEARAAGVPVIATAWAAGAELPVDHPLGAELAEPDAVALREFPQLVGARWAEPDRAHLRSLMRARVSGGVAPEPAQVPVAPDRTVARPRRGARPEDVSFVLQGPVERFGPGSTVAACASVRRHFPGAEIVVSTWEGARTRGLDCDVLVESPDPGTTGRATYNPNTNRLIASSLAGVRAATRPLVVKLRTDMQFLSDALLTHWGRWEERADELRVFERRILVPNTFTRRPSYHSPYPLHPSDWAFFGTRADIERLFDVPLMRRADTTAPQAHDGLSSLYCPPDEPPAYTPEQWIWVHALRRVRPDVALAHVFDLTPETLRLTELSFANNLAILDTYSQFGAWMPKYPWANRLYDDHTLYQHDQWLELYDRYVTRGDSGDDVHGILRRLAKGRDGTLAQADSLRRAGEPFVAQLLESAIVGPGFRRDLTTGGAGRWLADISVRRLARAHLTEAAKEASEAVTTHPRSGDIATATGEAE